LIFVNGKTRMGVASGRQTGDDGYNDCKQQWYHQKAWRQVDDGGLMKLNNKTISEGFYAHTKNMPIIKGSKSLCWS
jgi:hypothetical protein